MRRVGFVVGLRAEATMLGRFMVGVGGGEPAGAARAALTLLAQGATALISFGFAGGLDPDLAGGRLVVPRAVVTDDTSYNCDLALLDWLGGATTARLLAGSRVASTVAEKAALFAQTGAAAVDLESGAVARAAKSHGVPMAVLRAISDPAGRTLPPVAMTALDAGGGVGVARILLALARQPGQLPALFALAADAGRARATLGRQLKKLR